ncbi:hydroxyethylthiazole kinase [Lacrimispora sp. NSJ-141]|uniref:hydroxyethylthiazole kinase n=1 Tax=Lientehia hominis TaxID=2897778 RepID=A0AAP2RGU5_9FIRM|nr:hydroxyethylthiazole kinase [Lientehia hominis]MCD2491661.1 hydroxyethylthiazole kinase [Lientehia hominis]
MTENEQISKILELWQALPETKPLVHVIPNQVSAAFCADAMSASGARPVMAGSSLETGEITEHSRAFVANLGQPSREKEAAVRESLLSAARNRIPVVLDPVGAGASAYRLQLAGSLLSLPWKGIVKGNASEIYTICTGQLTHQGVDSIGFGSPELSPPANPLFSGRILAVTGKEDCILDDGGQRIILSHPAPLSHAIVGTGCAAGCLCGCFAALTEDLFLAAAAGLSFFSYAQSRVDDLKGYGSSKLHLLDFLSQTEADGFKRYLQSILTYQSGGRTK